MENYEISSDEAKATAVIINRGLRNNRVLEINMEEYVGRADPPPPPRS